MDFKNITAGQPPLTTEETNALLERFRAGDTSVRDRLILGHLALAMSKVNEYVECYGDRFQDDLEGEAMLELVKAIDRLREEVAHYDVPAAYIGWRIEKHLGDFLRSEGTVRVPPKSARKLGDLKPESTTDEEALVVPGREPEPWADLALSEEVLACAKCENERAVLRLLLDGRDLDQVSEKTGLSPHCIWVYRRRFSDRYAARSAA